MPTVGPSAASSATPLREDRLRSAVVVAGSMWNEVRVVAETGSTNTDLLRLAAQGAPQGAVLAAKAQTSARGRQGRVWQNAPGAALTFSVLLRPRSVPQSARAWVPLLAGVATVAAVRSVTGVDARLKWPNDILIGEGKLTGILAEQTTDDAIVVGIGLNVFGGVGDLPVPTATTLELHGAGQIDRNELLAEILRRIERWYGRWVESGDADACGLRPEYLRGCATIGRTVKIELPGSRSLVGTAIDVDSNGRLIVRDEGGDLVPISAGDVIHVRLTD
ncbi:MAG TPA: biotin--[acetyl-CoA-carboxylase] ligase [Streptosporangiaceae bacterium]|nr:biotin--[acetyl-CoA-carboxylase] ligase [Streptosporangiaceae bacterium]